MGNGKCRALMGCLFQTVVIFRNHHESAQSLPVAATGCPAIAARQTTRWLPFYRFNDVLA
jgi:hypothetical protein